MISRGIDGMIIDWYGPKGQCSEDAKVDYGRSINRYTEIPASS
jgi:hypothetical protein